MKTSDLVTFTADKINENLERSFGKRIDFSQFDRTQLEDARNKLRTQMHQMRSNSKFNENLENETFYETQWMLDALNAEIAERNESEEYEEPTTENTGENTMENIDKEFEQIIKEDEVEQASAIVTANSMVDKVSRWIEELSGMENDTLLSLGDSIRTEMGQQEAKQFLSTAAPAIEDALSHLKQTRDEMSNAVRVLTGQESATDMLGDEPEAEVDTDTDVDMDVDASELDMDVDDEDDFETSEPAAGGIEPEGREQRESVEHADNLYRILAG